MARKDNELMKEATIKQKALERRNHIIFTPRSVGKKVKKLNIRELI